jgi:3-methyladenine DNA glycosylase AlkD
VNDFIKTIKSEFEAHADSKIAEEQKAYLRSQFAFYGIKTPSRRAIQKPFLTITYLPPKENLEGVVKALWHQPQREYFKIFPKQRDHYVNKWIASNNIRLQRTCIIFQLLSKEKMDVEFLADVIKSLLNSKEFFINRAIGWALRDYSRTNPKWVKEFAANTDLHSLSRREALRLMN